MRPLHETWFRLADGTTRHLDRDDFRSTYEPGEYLNGVRIVAELDANAAGAEKQEDCHATSHSAGA